MRGAEGTAPYGMGNVFPATGGKRLGCSRATVWGKVSVCLPRHGNGTRRWEATWLTGRDGTKRSLGATGRHGTRERVGNVVGKSVGNIVG